MVALFQAAFPDLFRALERDCDQKMFALDKIFLSETHGPVEDPYARIVELVEWLRNCETVGPPG